MKRLLPNHNPIFALLLALFAGVGTADGAFVYEPDEIRDGDETELPCLPSHGNDASVSAWCGEESVEQTIALSAGTNWVSTYLDISLDDLKAALVAALPNTVITIKGTNNNTKYSRGQWNGNLTWNVAEMYKIIVADACEITLEGMPLNPVEHPITIKGEGKATWIGFPFSQSMSLTDAFAEIAQNNDAVKSEDDNSKFTRGRWMGAVIDLEPGKGYRYISAPTAADRTFTFPANTK